MVQEPPDSSGPGLSHGREASVPPPASAGFPLLDLYLFRQKVLAIAPTYDVFDENKRPVLHVVRPVRYLRTLLASAASLATLLYFGWLIYLSFGRHRLIAIGLIPVGLLASSIIRLLIEPYRHIYLFSDKTRASLLCSIVQERKLIVLNAPYTLLDEKGRVIARFMKNYFFNLFRRRWQIFTPDGDLVATAWEDSIPKSIARRFVGPLYGILRTNFIITRKGHRLGEFNRKFTIVDRYALDLRADPHRLLDRRLALALGILLDTGESR